MLMSLNFDVSTHLVVVGAVLSTYLVVVLL